MPHINLRVEKQKESGGSVSSPEGLLLSGPVVPVILTLPKEAAKGQVPKSLQGVALIDTGATTSCFDVSAAKEMGLPIRDSGRLTSVSHVVDDVPMYSGKLVIPGFFEIKIEKAFGVQLKQVWRNKNENSPQLIALIGRDILMKGVFIYHGPDGFMSLSI